VTLPAFSYVLTYPSRNLCLIDIRSRIPRISCRVFREALVTLPAFSYVLTYSSRNLCLIDIVHASIRLHVEFYATCRRSAVVGSGGGRAPKVGFFVVHHFNVSKAERLCTYSASAQRLERRFRRCVRYSRLGYESAQNQSWTNGGRPIITYFALISLVHHFLCSQLTCTQPLGESNGRGGRYARALS
jgi:hypothetical protein